MGILEQYIIKCSTPGTVLIFLPSFKCVMELYEMISNSLLVFELEVFTLHSYLSIDDYNRVFLPVSGYRRKVILCTAFAETSTALDDVFCVIDSGIVKDQEIDVVKTNQRQCQWISKVITLHLIMNVTSMVAFYFKEIITR